VSTPDRPGLNTTGARASSTADQGQTHPTGSTRTQGQGPAAPLLEVNNLVKYFPIRGGLLSRVVANVKAVNDISFRVGRGEMLGLVGESGSGKTTAGRALLRLIEPTSGEVKFDGVDVVKLSKGEMREYRRKMQIIFQDPSRASTPA
jgi:peptide/nickel transport system ATP-binding protein